jgi:hypothetical protein
MLQQRRQWTSGAAGFELLYTLASRRFRSPARRLIRFSASRTRRALAEAKRLIPPLGGLSWGRRAELCDRLAALAMTGVVRIFQKFLSEKAHRW